VAENPLLPPVLGQVWHDPRKKLGRPLRVLTLTPFYPSEGDDANGCFVVEPLQALASTEVQSNVQSRVFAVQPFYRGRLVAGSSDVPAQWMRYFSLPGGFGLPSAGAFLFARIVSLVRELQQAGAIDMVHSHGPLPCGHAAMLLNAELKIPYVVSVHGLDALAAEQVKGRAGDWCRRVSMRVFRASQRVICISEHVREQVLEGTGRSCRTTVVYNGVDPVLFSPGEGTEAGDFSVLSVGNLIPTKGHQVLIRAIASLVAEFPSITLEIIGDGPERLRLQALAVELQIANRVRFLGRQSRQLVADAMRRCSIFALPSRYEGLGCVYLEAMSAGKAVIGCRGQGIAEVIQHGSNGFLVGPDNEKELTLALAMLLRGRALRDRLGVAARDTILDRFTLAQQAQNLARIYRESVTPEPAA
jgi:teichuronic acid biosynthesis glycosyltransferase TuaC